MNVLHFCIVWDDFKTIQVSNPHIARQSKTPTVHDPPVPLNNPMHTMIRFELLSQQTDVGVCQYGCVQGVLAFPWGVTCVSSTIYGGAIRNST